MPKKIDEILYLGSAAPVHMGYYRYLGPTHLNPKLGSEGDIIGDLLATTDTGKAALLNRQIESMPSQINVLYNTSGDITNLGGYFFDTEEVLHQNVLNTYSPRRDDNYVYVDGQLVKNIVLTVWHVTLYGSDYYFDKYDNFYKFIIEYINTHSKTT